LGTSAANYAYNNPLQALGIAAVVAATVFQPENAAALPEEIEAIEGTVSLFRAVSLGEFEDIAATGSLNLASGALEAKQFALTLDEALAFANLDRSAVAIIEVVIPQSTLEALEFSSTIDPFLFPSGVVTAQGGAALQLLNDTLLAISHAF
jgi:hypothetical protein